MRKQSTSNLLGDKRREREREEKEIATRETIQCDLLLTVTYPRSSVGRESSVIVAPVVTRSVEQTSDDDENPHQEINDVENVVESDGTFDAVSEYSSHNEGNQTAKKVWIMLS